MKEDRASATAILVASGLLFLARAPRDPVPVPPEAIRLGEWLLGHYSSLTSRIPAVLERGWFRRLVGWIERQTVPGIVEHYARRKQAIESLAREALAQGISDLAILGAGFDTLACRLAREMPGLRAIEIDHPATQHWKRRGLVETGLAPANMDFIAEDLARRFPEGLPPQKRFWVAEGFLMYFPEERVRALFRAVHRLSPPGSRIAFTFLEIQDGGRPDFRQPSGWVNFWLARRREPFAWGIGRDALAAFLAPLGFRPLEIAAPATREMDRLAVGELLALYETA